MVFVTVTTDKMTDNNGSRAAPGLNVPEDIQDAILELIETCKE